MTKYNAPSIDTAARILDFLKNNSVRGRTFSEICRGVGIPKSTGFNILKTLQGLNYVEHDPDTKRYTLGWRLVELGGVAADRLGYLSVIRSHLGPFSRDTGLTCITVQRMGDNYVIVDRIDVSSGVRVVASVGQSHPLSFGAQGKVFLAALPEAELGRYLTPEHLKAYTPRAITDPDAYRRELALVRQQGWAASCEEAVLGVGCVAAPVYDPRGGLALVVSALGFTSQITPARVDEVGSRLKEIADAITATIAGNRETGASA